MQTNDLQYKTRTAEIERLNREVANLKAQLLEAVNQKALVSQESNAR